METVPISNAISNAISNNIPMPDESKQANIRICIALKENTAGELTVFVNDFDISNYDGLIADVPKFIQEFNLSYGIKEIVKVARDYATKLAQ